MHWANHAHRSDQEEVFEGGEWYSNRIHCTYICHNCFCCCWLQLPLFLLMQSLSLLLFLHAVVGFAYSIRIAFKLTVLF